MNGNTVGHLIRSIEKTHESTWDDQIDKLSLEPAYPHKHDITIQEKVRQMMNLEKSKRRVHFHSNEYVYNPKTGELQCKNI